MKMRVAPLVALVALANVAMLAAVRANRTGEPDARVTLTERELPLAYQNDRNSAQRLRIAVASRAVVYTSATSSANRPWIPYPWIDAARLTALGFDMSVPPSDERAQRFYGRQLRRRVWVAYEFDGDAWARYATERRRANAESAASAPVPARASLEENAEAQLSMESRLIAVDVGRDPVALRRSHPDRSRYLILPGTVSIRAVEWTEGGRQAALTGDLEPLSLTLVVPVHARAALDRLPTRAAGDPNAPRGPRYAAQLAVGRRYEPWIVSIEPLTR
jgi:hypothetical protein